MDKPKVTLGLPTYNGERYIRTAISSILSQTYKSFELIVCDNASLDQTRNIVNELASADPRIKVHCNNTNVGMILNFRRVAFLGRGQYFAWVSDHDIWEPTWLEKLVNALDANPDAVLAYPYTIAVDDDGNEISREVVEFNTTGLKRGRRTVYTCKQLKKAGDKVYGLFRYAPLRKTSLYPLYLMPDRLLLMQLSAYGTFYQVKEYLWRRRYTRSSQEYSEVTASQRTRLFPNGKRPWHSHVPTIGMAVGLLSSPMLWPQAPFLAFCYLRRYRKLMANDIKHILGFS